MVRCTPTPHTPALPPAPCTPSHLHPCVETSHGQAWYYFRQMTFGQMYPIDPTPCPLLSPHPVPCQHPSPSPTFLVETSCGHVWYYFVQMTCGQMNPPAPSPLMPPNPHPVEDISLPSVLLLWTGCPVVRLFPITFLMCN